MSNKVTIAQLVERNKHIAATNPPHNVLLADCPAHGMIPPQVLIITCADPRCDPTAILGLQSMEAVVFRNPCGHVAPDINGLLALDVLLDGFAEVMIMHHTDCGASMYTDEGVRNHLKQWTGAKQNLQHMTFGAVTDIEQSVRDDLAVIREHPLIRKELREKAVGFVYDIHTGLVTRVD